MSTPAQDDLVGIGMRAYEEATHGVGLPYAAGDGAKITAVVRAIVEAIVAAYHKGDV